MNKEIQIKIDIMDAMDNPFDYEEYVSQCKLYEVEPYDEQGFLQRMSWLQRSKLKYPDLDYTEAYLKYLAEKDAQTGTGDSPQKSGCGGCGGGKVR